MIVSDLAYLEELVDESAEELMGGISSSARNAVFQGGSSRVFTTISFGTSVIQRSSDTFSRINGAFLALKVSFRDFGIKIGFN